MNPKERLGMLKALLKKWTPKRRGASGALLRTGGAGSVQPWSLRDELFAWHWGFAGGVARCALLG